MENAKNFIMVIGSNILSLLSLLLVGFVLPKQLGVTGYAYYRVYSLYVGYAGFLHFGLVNGIYLKYGHCNKDELPVEKFRKFSRIMIGLQLAVAIVLAGIVLLMQGHLDQYTLVAYLFVALNIPLINIKWFYSSINQFTKRFIIDSCVTLLQSGLIVGMVVAISVFGWYNYTIVLIITTVVNAVCMIMVMLQNNALVFGTSREKVWQETGVLIKSGFFVMLSEFVAIIILGIDSIFVQNLFTVTDFAMYSFAVSILTVIYALISTVSNLIYPYLVRADSEKYGEYYSLMSDVLTVVSVLSMLAYYVAQFIVKKWLGEYEDSLGITAILFGTVVFRTLIMLVCGNYFKALKMIKEFTRNNVFAIIISFVTDLIAYLAFRNYYYIAIASLLSFIVWYVVTDHVFIKRLAIPLRGCTGRYLCIILCLTLFYGLLMMENTIVAFTIYMVGALAICFACFYKQFVKLFQIIRGK